MNLSDRAQSTHPRWHLTVYVVMAIIAVAATYEALFSLKEIALPRGGGLGEGPPFESSIVSMAVLAMTITSVVFVTAAFRLALARELGRIPGVWLLVALSAALVIARFYTFDPYYAPHLRRASSEGGAGAREVWVVVGVVGSALVGLLGSRVPRIAMLGIAMVLFLGAASVVLIRGFH